MLLDRCPLLEVLGGVSLSVHNEIDSHPREPAASILQVLLYVSSYYCVCILMILHSSMMPLYIVETEKQPPSASL